MNHHPNADETPKYPPSDLSYPKAYDEDDGYDIYGEIESLRKLILRNKSPGAAMLISNMEAFDDALCDLYESIDNFKPSNHHKEYAADLLTKRYIYLKKDFIDGILKYVMHEIETQTMYFHLTRENTELPPQPDGLATARAWRLNHNREKAREARSDRAVRKQTAARKAAAGASTSASTSPNLRSKASSSR